MYTGQVRNLKCYTNGRNTGRSGCTYIPKFKKGHILVPYAWKMDYALVDSDEDIAIALVAAIMDGLHENNPLERMQFIGKYDGFEDKSEAPVMQKKGYGSSVKTNDGTYIHEYTHSNGQDYHNTLRTYDGKQDLFKVLAIDANGTIDAANVYDDAGRVVGLMGLELDNINVYPRKEGTYEQTAEFRIGLTLANAKELNEDGFSVATGKNILSMCEDNAVIDVVIIPRGTSATRTFEFSIKTANGAVDLGDTFGAILAETTAFVFANKATGAAITVTSVAYSAMTKLYSVLLAAGGGYSATNIATVKLASVSTLHGLDISYYESDTREITMN